MRRSMLVTTVIAVLAVLAPTVAVLGQEVPPGPTVIYRTSMEVTSPPATFDTTNLVLDFAPGTWTPLHSHGGQGIVTVLEGEVIHQPEGGVERRIVAGESFMETPGNPHRAGNTSQARARVAFTILLPKDTQLTMVHDAGQNPPPGPTQIYRTAFEATNVPAPLDLVNLVLNFEPGAWTPLHSHGGQGMVTVLEGELVHRPEGGQEQRVVAGESFMETPGHPHMAGNTSGAKARILFTVLLPKGAALTTVVAVPQPAAPAELPDTGGLPTRAVRDWLAVLVAIGLLVAGWRLRRARIQV